MTVIVAAGLIAAVVGYVDAPEPVALKAYREQVARAGRSAESQVKLALWCEEHGLEAERVKHLAVAVLTDPNHATARALLGLLKHGDRWRSPDEVAAKVWAEAGRAAAL